MTINLAAIESSTQALEKQICSANGPWDMPYVTLEICDTIAALVAEVRRLEKAVSDISHLASGHHREQPSHVLLHCLTIDIPAICDAALTTTTSE